MKRLLWFVLLATAGFAQGPTYVNWANASLRGAAGAPTGSCFSYQLYINTSTGDLYDCPAGSWVLTGNTSGGTGNVVGPASATSSDIAVFGDATGKLLADGGGPVPADTSATASNFLTAYTRATGVFTKAQPTLAAIAGGTAPAGAYDFTNITTFTLPGTIKIPAAGITFTPVSGSTTTLNCGAAGSSSCVWVFAGSTSGTATVGCSPIGACTSFGSTSVNATFGKVNTGANCAGTGTAANPSVVTCTSAAAGGFSCATNASTGTCQVNTTAVTANSEIFIQPTAASASLTCNATADTGLTVPRLLSQSAGASFTISLGTFSTTAECFKYYIVN